MKNTPNSTISLLNIAINVNLFIHKPLVKKTWNIRMNSCTQQCYYFQIVSRTYNPILLSGVISSFFQIHLA